VNIREFIFDFEIALEIAWEIDEELPNLMEDFSS
jgi:hypothetical protein